MDERTCPQCLNPHTLVVDERARGVRRFCPMCDFSWMTGKAAANGKAARKRGPEKEKTKSAGDG